MKPLFTRLTGLCFVFCLCISGRIPAQSPPSPATVAAAPSPTPAEVISPVPSHWFDDCAKVTSPIFAIELDRRLERFQRETNDQFVVVIFPKMQSPASLDDYCLRVFNAWGIGQKGVNNGVILFVFMEDHKLRIQVGRGLETPLTNPVCQGIVERMKPAFQRGDFEAGITAGVDAIVEVLQTQPRPQVTTR